MFAPTVRIKADVVLTTYSIVESEYRRCIAPPKVACQYCGDKFYPRQLITHLRYFCGPDAQKSAAQAAQHKKKTRKGHNKTQRQQLKGGREKPQKQRRKANRRAKHEDSNDDSDFSAPDESDSDVLDKTVGGVADHNSTAATLASSHNQPVGAEQAAERARGGVLHAVQW